MRLLRWLGFAAAVIVILPLLVLFLAATPRAWDDEFTGQHPEL